MRQQGVALITVLLVVALVTVIASALMARQHLAVRSTGNHLAAKQASQHAQGAEILAKAVLERDWQQDDRERPVDHLLEAWAYPMPAFELDDGSLLNMTLVDAAGLFNVNRLISDEVALAQFRRLLLRLGIKPTLAETLKDWLDADHEVLSSESAEENHYLLQSPPYRTANRAMSHISELRLLKGLSFSEYQKLAPFVSALPPTTALNINTAPAEVLSSLADGLSLEHANALVKGRTHFTDTSSFVRHPLVSQFNINTQGLTVNSQYFQVHASVSHDGRTYEWIAHLQRAEDGRVRVLARELNGTGAVLPKDEPL